jgi:quercetin dioxygenase-like cupin family protein
VAEGAIGDIKYYPYYGILTALDDLSTGHIGALINTISKSEQAQTISFEETSAGASLDWHNAPHRQYVITLSGRLEFETRTGGRQVVEPGDILLAEDTSGGGHRWRLVDDQPWRRVYVGVP